MSSLLRKRFDSSKCKTLLQLTSQRLKVLRNKQALAVKKARVDVAKLLEKNQDSNAKMQVETVFREEKLLAFYDLLDQFCRLVINGLESIKSQKECPLDLREAVASLIFAAPKCAELEELKQVSKHLTLKYGTDFSVAAKELRPDCGVNKQIIQSLSSRPPDFDAKLKLLKEIAVANNINWHETIIADVSKGATDLIDGPNHFASATELSQVGAHVITDKQKSRSMHVNEFKGPGNAVLQNAIGSQTMSAANSLGSPLHEGHRFEKINMNTGAMGSSMVSDRVVHTPVLDPYALARAEGKMDYNVVSDYMKRAQSMELKQENSGGVAYGKTPTQLPEREQRHNVCLDASHCEDPLQKSKGKKPKKRRDMMNGHRRNEEELLELKNAAEYAFMSANHAAEAARAAVNMVRMESLERSRGSKAVNINKLQEMELESRSVLAWDENYKLAGMDSKRSSDRHELSCEDEVEIEPSQHNGMVGDQVSEMNSRFTLDASEDSFKYVVFEQTSGSQKYTQSSTQAERYNKNSEAYASPEVWSEPTLYSRKNSDRIIFDTEYEESGSKEVPTHALFDSFRSDSMNEQEFHKKASSSNSEGTIYNHTEAHQDKHVQSDLSVPQFDDYSSDEDRYVQENLSAPQVEDHIIEEANEEEEPFYLRGRAAMAPEDDANVTGRAPHSKTNMLMSTVSFSIDDEVEEESSTNMRSSKREASVHIGLSAEPLGVSNDKEKPLITGNSSAKYVDEGSQKSSFDDYEELESLPNQSSKTPLRCQISTKSTNESSITSPAAYKDSSVNPTTPRKLKWSSSISEEWDLDPSYYNLASPSGSVKLHSLNENRDPSSQVNRKLNWLSGASEDSESMSERSFDSHKLGWNLEDLNLDSPKPSFNMEDSTKIMDATQDPQPSTRKSYYGVSKRSVRSTRSRKNQDIPSPSSGNEDIRSP